MLSLLCQGPQWPLGVVLVALHEWLWFFYVGYFCWHAVPECLRTSERRILFAISARAQLTKWSETSVQQTSKYQVFISAHLDRQNTEDECSFNFDQTHCKWNVKRLCESGTQNNCSRCIKTCISWCVVDLRGNQGFWSVIHSAKQVVKLSTSTW